MVSRSRQKSRRTKKAILFVGEGPTEKAFLQHLQQMYITRDMNIVVKVESGSGGSPRSVIEKAIRLRSSRSYDQCFVLIDKDLPFAPAGELKKRMRKKLRIEILNATPCIEGLFLAILNPRFSQQSKSTDFCKSAFEGKYISQHKKSDKRSYEKIFSKQILDERRQNVVELDAILRAMGV
ncbi:hypothetical protein MNBD_UNCLBAC01-1589 [hydrothermal vent metagenome]|uniref:RloB domain-containing protein n=1 Tax=hydrothermal vent metagenome TaxID=652676 RepID=A0A3B1DQD5_9ZZZZ